jgi:hypothetical protein
MGIDHDAKSIQLTSAEMAYLWGTYVMNCKGRCVASYLAENLDDRDLRLVMLSAFDMADRIVGRVSDIFNSSDFPIPYGFDDGDVNLKAGKLFSDKLMMYILKYDTLLGFSSYGMSLSLSARSDVKKFFTESIRDAIDLMNRIDRVLLEKGIFTRTPDIPTPEEAYFTSKQGFFGSFFGEKRPLNALEVTHIFITSLTGGICRAQAMGLEQTVKDNRIRKFEAKCSSLMKEHIESLNKILSSENLDTPPNLDTQVLSSKEPPFSERLILFFTLATITDLINSYATTITNTTRKDITPTLLKQSAEAALLLKDAVDIMLDHDWLEEVPLNSPRP